MVVQEPCILHENVGEFPLSLLVEALGKLCPLVVINVCHNLVTLFRVPPEPENFKNPSGSNTSTDILSYSSYSYQ